MIGQVSARAALASLTIDRSRQTRIGTHTRDWNAKKRNYTEAG